MMNNKARTSLTGTTFYSHNETHPGLTLYSPICSNETYLISMSGEVIHKWKTPHKPGAHAELLPNGNLLYACKIEDGPLADFEGAGGKLIEMDKDGKIVWEYEDPYHHHTFKRLSNGNTLILKWVKVPEAIAKEVKGGIPNSEKDGVMWGDVLQEITPSKELIWEWNAYNYLDPIGDSICPICSRAEWTHMTSIDVLENDNILLNCMRTNQIIVVNRKTGLIELRWGKDELSHPNNASVLKNGNFLIFDTGRHCRGEGIGFSRPIEINPETLRMVWSYEEDPPTQLYSCFLGSCQRLPNDNTLICEGTSGRFMEVNMRGGMVWEYVHPKFHDSKEWGMNRYVFSAKRYGLDYEGLRNFYGLKRDWKMWDELPNSRPDAVTPEKEAASKISQSMEDSIRSRLEPLGY